MATYDQLVEATLKAHSAGDTANAQIFADMAKELKVAPVTGAAQIPGTIRAAPPEAPLSMREKISGAIETPVALAANLVSGPVTYLAGAGGPDFQRKVASQIQYQPRTRLAGQALEAVGSGLEASKLPPFMPMIGGATNALAPAMRAVGDVAGSEGSLISGAVGNALANRAAKTQAANVSGSYAAAPIIDAAQAASRQGLAVNPAITNPTMGNRAKGMLVGATFDEAAAKANANQTTAVVRKDLGLAPNEPLSAAAVDTALNTASKPYDVVRKMPQLAPDDKVIASMESLRIPMLIGDEGASAKVNLLIDTAIDKVSQGRAGALVIDDIRQLRKQAQSVYKARDAGTNPAPADVAAADAKIGLASTLEALIDANVTDPNVLGDIKLARTRMAQIYDHDRAINYANGTVDPQAYAKMLNERKGSMTGVGADIGRVAATFPEVMNTQTPSAMGLPKVTRSGITAAGGALLGGAVAGYPGAIAGASLGGAAGWTGTQLAARRMAAPSYQQAYAAPTDYRPTPSLLRPVEPNLSTTNALAPYDFRNALVQPSEVPNFTIGRSAPQVTTGAPPVGPPQLGAPSAQGTLQGVAQRRAFDYNMQSSLEQQAAQQAAAQAAAGRQVTGAGTLFDLDPITGRLREASAGIRGATPETWMADTGASLKAASEKVSKGQLFDLSAAEKVAWDKTKVDLAAAMPEFKGLSDKALAAKAMDRQWVNDTIDKIRQKAQAFDDISNRAETAQAARNATMQREKMLDLLSSLEDSLRPARPTSVGGQGPKTRAFNRNKLAPLSENQLGNQ